MPLVSIIIPAYNAAHYLPDSIESCLVQTHTDIEIIVVDDGSQDETARVAARYPQVRYIHQSNQGPAAARNNGIAHATGDYLQFLDADDLLLPTKLKCCLAAFAEHPQAGLVYCDYDYRTPDMRATSPTPKPPVPMIEGHVLAHLINHTPTMFCVPCPLVKSEIVRQVGGFTQGFNGVEDWHFWIKLAALGIEFRFVPEVLVWYRHTDSSLSRNPSLMAQSRLQAMLALESLHLPTSIQLDEKIAGRHHALAMLLWYEGKSSDARAQLKLALRRHPKGRWVRWFFYFTSYLFPAQFIDGAVNAMVKLTKRNQMSGTIIDTINRNEG